MKVLVLIPARGGSKGLPGKNLRTVAGISLVGRAAWIGRRFLQDRGLTGTVLIDTDSEEIAREAVRWGAEAPFLRPPELAGDATPMIDNVLHAIERLKKTHGEYDAFVLLQPTSPLRNVDDVIACWKAYDPAIGSVVAITRDDHPAEWTLRRADDGVVSWAWAATDPEGRRQDFPLGWRLTGAVYVSSIASLKENRSFLIAGRTRGVGLPGERSVDVDTAQDLALADLQVAAGGTSRVHIANREIGPTHPCYVIAEAGVNHNGDVALAHKLVDVASDAGADAVKFQTFDPKKLVSDSAAMAAYQVANTGKTETQAAMLERLVLPKAAHEELQQHARERKITFLSSPFDEGSADFLEELGVPAFKVASGELTNHPFIAHLARKKRPLLISTGMAEIVEVAEAIAVTEDNGRPPLALFHCVTNYPAAPSDSNLLAMRTMQSAFGWPVGWSDHTEGVAVSLAAVSMGACLIEKHYTLDRSMPGPDHKASLSPQELKELVAGIRLAEAVRGDGMKKPRASEIPLIAAARKSLHAAAALPAGHVLREQDLIALRPGTGMSPARIRAVVGRTLARAVAQGQLLAESDLG